MVRYKRLITKEKNMSHCEIGHLEGKKKDPQAWIFFLFSANLK